MNWDDPATVSRFVESEPNPRLVAFTRALAQERGPLSILDIGCGAGRNAIALASSGHHVTGIDRSLPMLNAATKKASDQGLGNSCLFLQGEMDTLLFPDGSFDLVVAHGIWNLAESDDVFVAAIDEACRVAAPGAGLFVFTFERTPQTSAPQQGSRFATQGSDGGARCFATVADLEALLAARGFRRAPGEDIRHYNQAPNPGSPPPIVEGIWKKSG